MSKSGYEKDSRYIDPEKIRGKIFNTSIIKSISNWSAKKINDIETKLNPDKPDLIKEDKDGNLTENCSMIGNFEKAFAKNQCFIPLREEIYNKEVFEKGFEDPYLDNDKPRWKGKREKCSGKKWAEILAAKPTDTDGPKRDIKKEILDKSVEQTKEYLRNTEHFNEDEIQTFMKTRYVGIKQVLEKIIQDEIDTCKAPKTVPPTRKLVEKSKSFWDLFRHPKELFEVLRLRTFHKFFTFLAMSTLNFVKVVDYGKEGESFRQRNLIATYTGIEIGDNEVACNQELTAVLAHTVKEAGSAVNWLHDICTLNFGRALSYDSVDAEANHSIAA